MKSPVRVAVTGAAGQIGYALLFRIAAGDMLGEDQPVILHLLEITPALGALNGVVMELNDCAFPTLAGVVATDDANVAFKDIDYALLVGARKHAFPLEQFVDGRPIEGIADVLKVVGNPRRAWLWLVQESPLLGNKRPIDLLKQDRKDEVMDAARTVFEYP